MGKMTVLEAMPKRVIRLFRVIRAVVIAGVCLFLFFFVRQEKGIMEQYRQLRSDLRRMAEYGQTLAEAVSSYENGDLAASEELYLRALSEGLTDEQPYLGLAEIFLDRKWYERALEVLKTYPAEIQNDRISDKIEELEELVRTLEQSRFLPAE